MDILNFIDHQTILITPTNVKRKLLIKNKKLFNIKSFTKEELKRKSLFDYDHKTIYYLMNKYNLRVDVALMYLKNMYYIDKHNYDSNKLNTLLEMKDDLINNNQLIIDNLFINNLKHNKVVVYGYNYIDKFFQRLLDIISQYTEVKVIENKKIKANDIKLYEFNDIEDEINFAAYSICELITQGIDINHIKLGNITEEYIIPLKRIFSFYNIPLNLIENISLYGTNIVLSFIDIFKETNDLKDSLNQITELYDLTNQYNLDIYNKLVNICNNYLWFNKEDNIIDLLINDFKQTYIKQVIKSNAVEVIELKDNIIDDSIYVFILGFNQGSMPVIYKDEEYITDDVRHFLDIETSSERNIIERQVCLDVINNLSHVIITYKLKTRTDEYYPSSLITELDITPIINFKLDITKSYSVIQDKIKLSKKLDKLVKYDELAEDIDVLYYNYQDILYKSYDNSFTGIDNHALVNYLSPKLRLSYSSIDNYFKCAFKYYINNVIQFKTDEEAFHLTIGNLFHHVLAASFLPDFDFDKIWSDFLKDKVFSNKELFFLEKLKDELQFVIKTINTYNDLSTFDKALYEEKIYVNLPNKIDTVFSGIIDKIMYKEGDNTLVALIDYKTGSTDLNLNNTIHGLNLQLPVYLYLVKNSHKFNNPTFVGFYLQEILHNETTNDGKKSYDEKKRDALKLRGYSIDQADLISQFDTSYCDSQVIKSMKVSNKGFYSFSKVINEQQIDQLITLVDNKIKESASNIINGKFDINPKRLGHVNVSCQYCKFKDMCYIRDKDVITLKEYCNTDFLGGENNE